MKHQKKHLISLRQATKLCDYSADYLKLRARQGKLKAEKIDGAWMTSQAWVEDFVLKTQKYWQKRRSGLSSNKASSVYEKPTPASPVKETGFKFDSLASKESAVFFLSVLFILFILIVTFKVTDFTAQYLLLKDYGSYVFKIGIKSLASLMQTSNFSAFARAYLEYIFKYPPANILASFSKSLLADWQTYSREITCIVGFSENSLASIEENSFLAGYLLLIRKDWQAYTLGLGRLIESFAAGKL